MNSRLFAGGALLAPVLLAILAGCSEQDPALSAPREVTSTQRPIAWGADDKTRLMLPDMSMRGSGGSAGSTSVPAYQAPTPAGWTELPPNPSTFRHMLWQVGGSPETECYLTVAVGGGRDANLNRWVSGQFGQAALTHEQIEALPVHSLMGKPAKFVELQGTFQGRSGPKEGHAMLGLISAEGDRVDTLKLTGPAAIVLREKESFLRVAAAIEPKAAPAPGAEPAPKPAEPQQMPQDAAHATAVPPAAPQPGFNEFAASVVPAGWQAQQGTGMRLLRYQAGEKTEAYLGRIGGDLAALLDVWRGEMGLQAMTEAERAALPKAPMLGSDAVLLELQGEWRGMSGELKDAAMLVAAQKQGTGVVFAKMVGPAATVSAQKASFLAFCAGLEQQ